MDWQPVIDPLGRGYCPGFDPAKEYYFRRNDGQKATRFRMRDMHPMFNIGGLYWAETGDDPWAAFVSANGIKSFAPPPAKSE